MAYTPDWESLADALTRVMATGMGEDEAKNDLCRAMADRKIDVRVKVAMTDYGMRGRVFSGRNVGVPPHLKPGDLDWAQSRPFARWSIGPRPGEHYTWIGGWENQSLDLIELLTANLIEVLCGKPLATAWHETSTTEILRSDAGKLKRGPRSNKLEKVKQLMRDDIDQGRQTTIGLRNMLEKNLANRYGVSRDTARKARTAVLSEFVEDSKATNDK